MKNSLIFYRDWYEAAQELSPDERLQYLDAIMLYAFKGKVGGSKLIKAATALVRSTIDRDNDAYERKCERNRLNILKRWKRRNSDDSQQVPDNTKVNGGIQTYTNATDNDNDNDNGNDNGNDNETTAKAVVNNKEKSTNVDKKKSASTIVRRFVKPSANDVEAYCKERGNDVDAQRFVDFYESKGWKVGNSPMKDWKAAVRTWEKRDGRSGKTHVGATLGVGEWIDSTGRRTYGTGKATIPMSAPARPSERYCWDAQSQTWILL